MLERVIRYARSAGLLVLIDAKRGDIADTASAYAQAYLSPDAPFSADAMTVNPYLGPESLEPFMVEAEKAELTGTIRAYSMEHLQQIVRRVEALAQGVAPSFGAQAAVLYRVKCPPAINEALEIDKGDDDKELESLKGLGREITTFAHTWCHWRSMYVKDPEGNIVELVYYDESAREMT